MNEPAIRYRFFAGPSLARDRCAGPSNCLDGIVFLFVQAGREFCGEIYRRLTPHCSAVAWVKEQWQVDVVPRRPIVFPVFADLVRPSCRVLEYPVILN